MITKLTIIKIISNIMINNIMIMKIIKTMSNTIINTIICIMKMNKEIISLHSENIKSLKAKTLIFYLGYIIIITYFMI